MTQPLVIGFDTSGSYCGAALMQGNSCLAAAYEDMAKGQAERLMPMLQELLAEAHMSWSDLDAIGVGVGPGNFTGIRLSVSAARGLAIGLGIPAIGVTLLDALAYETTGPVLACLDARRGKGYFQRFGYGDETAFLGNVDSINDKQAGLKCIGTLGAEMADHLDAEHAPSVYAPGSAIARIARDRLGQVNARPKPFYLREADAAPSKETPPAIIA